MQLRYHPLMRRKSGLKVWPPHWTTTRRDPLDRPTGEIGTLTRALMNDLFNNKIFLFIEHDGSKYMGSMHFDDPMFCFAVFNLLKANEGRTIEEIGGLDLSYLL